MIPTKYDTFILGNARESFSLCQSTLAAVVPQPWARWASRERPKDRPIHYQQMFGTLYRHLGINPATTTIIDPNNRPQYLLEETDPIRDLV